MWWSTELATLRGARAIPGHTKLGSVNSTGLGTQPGTGSSCWLGCESRKKPKKRGRMGEKHNFGLLLKLSPAFHLAESMPLGPKGDQRAGPSTLLQ